MLVTGSLSGLPSGLSGLEFPRYSRVCQRTLLFSQANTLENLFAEWPLVAFLGAASP